MPRFLDSYKSVNQMRLFLFESILALKNAPYHISQISPLVFPKPRVICCFIVPQIAFSKIKSIIFWGELAPRPLQKTRTLRNWPHLRIRCQLGYSRRCFPHNIFQNLTGLFRYVSCILQLLTKRKYPFSIPNSVGKYIYFHASYSSLRNCTCSIFVCI